MTHPHPDTQWPRWEVFKQDGPGKVHQAVGSVHATDADHALYTARSVFARRPSAVSLRAVRAADIHAVTLEELGAGVRLPGEAGEAQPYRVFAKKTHKRSMTFVDELGEVEADSPQAALERAREAFGDGLLVWWVIPVSAFVGTPEDADTVESWFAPAKEKTYKQQSSYGVVGQHISKHKTPRKGGDHE
ncbi:phenylacetic acid degradation protein [Deinococcus sp. YIM 134068]|uniref:phenylacetic acid degradation protein n=1 Tax=Deinococcus lichenicola TaxID=3118910 RepID=UPI002F952B29